MAKLSWINKHITKLLQRQAPKLEYKTGEVHYFQGQSYLLNVVNCRQNMVAIRGNKYIELFTAANKISVHNHKDRCKRVMGNWYKGNYKE